MTSHFPAMAPAIEELFVKRRAGMIEIGVLQPADPFLDMAGEDLRRRIFLTESETGEQLCLRPEFTIPVCLNHISLKTDAPHRYAYLGEVFRQRREGQAEFFQAGIEDLGDVNTASADARLIADAHALLELALPETQLSIVLGDQSVFEAVLNALGLPRGWQRRLARAFGLPDVLAAALADLARDPAKEGGVALPENANGGLETLADHIARDMRRTGFSPTLGRAPDEIATRLIEKTELQSIRLSEKALTALRTFLGVTAPLDKAASVLNDFARTSGLMLGPALDNFADRARAIAAEGLPVQSIRYDAAFGRPLDYYTGLVFEIMGEGEVRPLAGGGRYDRLLTLLGAARPTPAVGFSAWLDRIVALQKDGERP